MNYQEIASMVESFGLPFTYYSFPEKQAPALPYVIFYYPSDSDFIADNINYARIDNVNIELYTKVKNFELEGRIESILNENGFVFFKSQQYINSERMFEVLYEIENVKGE